MRFVRLNARGARGMTPQVACQQMVAAKIAAGNSEGALMITPVRPTGDFVVAFENHAHATRFIDFLGAHSVARRQYTALPSGLSLRTSVVVPPQLRNLVPQGVQLMMIDGPVEAELFAGSLS